MTGCEEGQALTRGVLPEQGALEVASLPASCPGLGWLCLGAVWYCPPTPELRGCGAHLVCDSVSSTPHPHPGRHGVLGGGGAPLRCDCLYRLDGFLITLL